MPRKGEKTTRKDSEKVEGAIEGQPKITEAMSIEKDMAGAPQGDFETTTADIGMEARLIQAMSEMKKDIIDHVETVRKDILSKVTNLEAKVKQVEDSVEFAHRDIADIKEAHRKQVEEINTGFENRIQDLEARLKKSFDEAESTRKENEEALNKIERYSREFNLRVGGVKEIQGENCHKIIEDLINENELLDCEREEIFNAVENAHRVGVKKQDGDRHIIVRMYSRPVRNYLMKNARKQRDRLQCWFMDNLTKADYELKQKAKQQMAEAYQNKKKVYFWRGGLYIEDRKVKINGT